MNKNIYLQALSGRIVGEQNSISSTHFKLSDEHVLKDSCELKRCRKLEVSYSVSKMIFQQIYRDSLCPIMFLYES